MDSAYFTKMVRLMSKTGDSPMALRNDPAAAETDLRLRAYLKAASKILDEVTDEEIAAIFNQYYIG